MMEGGDLSDKKTNLHKRLADLQRLYQTSKNEIKNLNQELGRAWTKLKKEEKGSL